MEIGSGNSDSPILRLHGDVWAKLADRIDIACLQRLIMVGCPQLSALLTRNVKNMVQRDIGPDLDFNAILKACQALSSLETFEILTSEYASQVSRAISLENFPSQVWKLSLNFQNACTSFEGFDFATLTPNLRHLTIGGPNDVWVAFESFLLPPNMEVLNLIPGLGGIAFKPSDIRKLPRSLTSLGLNIVINDNDDNTFETETYDWPLSLTSLRIGGSHCSFNLEYLPRTVTSLDLGSFKLKTAFSDGSVFPWRSFFPRLSELYLPRFMGSDLNPQVLLKSLVVGEEARQEADAFLLANRFCHVESLLTPATYPAFKVLSLPEWFWPQRNIAAQLEAVAHFIADTDFKNIMLPDFSLLKHAGATTSASCNADSIENEKFPASLTSLNGLFIFVSSLHPNLTSLGCNQLLGKDDSDRSMISSDDLPNFTELQLRMYHPAATISILPTTLTALELTIATPEEWDLVATRLTVLRDLIVDLHPRWKVVAPLKPIKSTYLELFSLKAAYKTESDPSKPNFFEFFESPSPIPSTISKLLIQVKNIHASVIPIVPRGLLKLRIKGLVWATNSKQFEGGASLTPEEIFERLPLMLRTLDIAIGDSTKDVPSAYVATYVPYSLGEFCNEGCFYLDDDLESIHDIMPANVYMTTSDI